MHAQRPKFLKFGTAALVVLAPMLIVPMAGAATTTCASTYIVQPGDSWSKISHATGIYIRPLAAANGMTRDSKIHPGMELCVPPADSGNSPQPSSEPTAAPSATTPAPAEAPVEPTEQCAAEYRVRRGDSWSKIAKRLRMSPSRLAALNATTIDAQIHPGDILCSAAADDGALSPNEAPAAPPTTVPSPPKGACEEAIERYRRALCMDLSERRVVIGGRDGTVHVFPAVAGYGEAKNCHRTFAGLFFVRLKQEITPRKKLKWGMSFGGGCVGDQIVHAVSPATMGSALGTEGCIGLLEADAKTAYDTLRVGDPLVIVD